LRQGFSTTLAVNGGRAERLVSPGIEDEIRMAQEDERRCYDQPSASTTEEVEAVIARDDPAELYVIPISVSLYHEDLEWSQAVCVMLSAHCDATVRGNAVLGFGHLARRFGWLDEGVVRPIIENALKDDDAYVVGQAHDAGDDVEHFLGWKVKGLNS
jgi:hypothetical protein